MELGMGNIETRSEFVQGGGIVVDSLGEDSSCSPRFILRSGW
jgi:hypothetical protein